ncbi:MAG: GGDEF domain-containing protein [Deltaproteobacteria bacterium]|nr:GGDEF domain-containing protein [Deltaproteobacteria bacterium]TLN02782.1 MAG: GGDEF domain-containing protein [bacterium]
MKIRDIERTALFKKLVRHLGCYQGDPTSQDLEKMAENRGRMLLVIRTRWILLLMLSAYGLYAGSLFFFSRPGSPHATIQLAMPAGILLAAASFNLFYQLFYRELSHLTLSNHLQILLDILVTTSLIHYGGGISSPAWAIYPFLAIEAALLLERKRDTWLFCMATILAFGILLVAETSENFSPAGFSPSTAGLSQGPIYSLLLWTWTAFMTTAMTIIASQMIGANRRKELTLKQLVVKDQTTKLYNRSYFFKELNSEIQRSIRYNHVFSIIFLDIDHFKEFNDAYGHLEGDRALKELAGILRKNIRRSETNPSYDIDVPCRYGGEEFGVILPETPINCSADGTCIENEMHAVAFAERIRQEIESLRIQGRKITVSIGIASFPDHGNTPDELVKAADDALYLAKSSGKNRIFIAEGKVEPQNGISSSGLNTGSSYPWEAPNPESSELFADEP